MSKIFTGNTEPAKKSVVTLNRNKLHMKQIRFPSKVQAIQYTGDTKAILDFAQKHIPDISLNIDLEYDELTIEYFNGIIDKSITLEYSDWLMLHNDNLHSIKDSYFHKHYESEDKEASTDAILTKMKENGMIA